MEPEVSAHLFSLSVKTTQKTVCDRFTSISFLAAQQQPNDRGRSRVKPNGKNKVKIPWQVGRLLLRQNRINGPVIGISFTIQK